MRVVFHDDVHEPHQELARDAGLASDSRRLAQVAPDGHGSADFAVVMALIVVCLAIWYFAC